MRKPKTSLLIPAINNSILSKQTLNVYGNKYNTKNCTCIRDYIHVEDLTNASLLSLNLMNKNKSEIFCLSSSIGKTVLEIIKIAEKQLKLKKKSSIKENRKGNP